MKSLFIVGLVAWLMYQGTQREPSEPPGTGDGGVTVDIGPTFEDETPREHLSPAEFSRFGSRGLEDIRPMFGVYENPSGSAWAVQSAHQFADSVGSIPIGPPRHITGVVHVGGR